MTRSTPKPRPGPDPGPRPTTRETPLIEVPGQARDAASRRRRVRIHGAPFLATLLLATPALAQVIPTGTPAADILLSQAIAEHRLFLTCSALDPQTHQQILAYWQRDVASATAILTAQGVAPDAIAALTAAADPAALMPGPDTPWAEVTALCATQPDWQTAYFQLKLTVLELKLPGAFP